MFSSAWFPSQLHKKTFILSMFYLNLIPLPHFLSILFILYLLWYKNSNLYLNIYISLPVQGKFIPTRNRGEHKTMELPHFLSILLILYLLQCKNGNLSLNINISLVVEDINTNISLVAEDKYIPTKNSGEYKTMELPRQKLYWCVKIRELKTDS